MTANVSHKVGALELVALTDGSAEFGHDLFLNTSDDEIDAILKAAGTDTIKTNFNAFLVRGGDGLTLVDAGPRELMGPTAGDLPAALAAAGVEPGDVTRLIFTHLHPDHIAGSISPEGAAIFTNAEVFVQQDDIDFWGDAANTAGKGEALEAWQGLAANVLSGYGARVHPISGAVEIAPGISALPLPGHTPGHMGLRISDGAAQAIIAGDIVHAQVLQLANPEIGVGFDIDPDAARAARKRMLDMLATDGLAFSGGHILAPGKFGHVSPKGAGYAFEPLT